VKLRANPFYRRVREAVREGPIFPKTWCGVAFRSVSLAFARPEQIIDGVGAMKSGARWNPPGRMRALYCSLNPGTAAEESMRLFEAAGFRRKTVKPRLIVGIRYRLGAVMDLAALITTIAGANLPELMAEEWQQINAKGHETQGQAIGRALFNSKTEAFLVPSARVPDARNLVVFPRNLQPASRQEILEEEELKIWLKQQGMQKCMKNYLQSVGK
jgi:RES domain-containing protein